MGELPQADPPVLAPGRDECAARVEDDGPDLICMAAQCPEQRPATPVPDADLLVIRGTGQQPAVGAQSHAVDRRRLLQAVNLARAPGPDDDSVISAAAGKEFAVRAERDAANGAHVGRQVGPQATC
jgi:hypothetical protein